MPLELDYYYGNEAEQYSFYRIPKVLFTDSRFRGVSVEAKVLYGLLLDRMSLSIKNGWVDGDGRVYIIFTIADVMETLVCAEQKANRLLGELDCAKGVGLIERKRRGLGKPNVIYVKNFIVRPQVPPGSMDAPERSVPGGSSDASGKKDSLQKLSRSVQEDMPVQLMPQGPAGRLDVQGRPWESQIQNCENHKSGNVKITGLELRKSQTNNTDLNNTEMSNTDPSINPCGTENPGTGGKDGALPVQPEERFGSPAPGNGKGTAGRGRRTEEKNVAGQMDKMGMYSAYCALIRENISYSILLERHPHDRERLDGFVGLMAEVCCSTRKTIRINQDDMCTEVVKGRFLKIDSSHIEYVMDCLDRNTTLVANIRAYTLSALFNAPVTISQYYASLVSHDMAHGFDGG